VEQTEASIRGKGAFAGSGGGTTAQVVEVCHSSSSMIRKERDFLRKGSKSGEEQPAIVGQPRRRRNA